jgi:hypothetical protein
MTRSMPMGTAAWNNEVAKKRLWNLRDCIVKLARQPSQTAPAGLMTLGVGVIAARASA